MVSHVTGVMDKTKGGDYDWPHRIDCWITPSYVLHGTFVLTKCGLKYAKILWTSRAFQKLISRFSCCVKWSWKTGPIIYFYQKRLRCTICTTVSVDKIQKSKYNWIGTHTFFFFHSPQNTKIFEKPAGLCESKSNKQMHWIRWPETIKTEKIGQIQKYTE